MYASVSSASCCLAYFLWLSLPCNIYMENVDPVSTDRYTELMSLLTFVCPENIFRLPWCGIHLLSEAFHRYLTFQRWEGV
jgi:hypothetical protein